MVVVVVEQPFWMNKRSIGGRVDCQPHPLKRDFSLLVKVVRTELTIANSCRENYLQSGGGDF